MHGEHCNCESCWWANGQKEICPTCGSIVGGGCPHTEESLQEDSQGTHSRPGPPEALRGGRGTHT